MRLESVLGPDARHRHVRDAPQLGRQFAQGPVRRPVTRGVFRRPGQDAGLDPIRHFVAGPSGVAGEQLRQSIGGKALVPPTAGRLAARLLNVLHEYASGSHGSACSSRYVTARFRPSTVLGTLSLSNGRRTVMNKRAQDKEGSRVL